MKCILQKEKKLCNCSYSFHIHAPGTAFANVADAMPNRGMPQADNKSARSNVVTSNKHHKMGKTGISIKSACFCRYANAGCGIIAGWSCSMLSSLPLRPLLSVSVSAVSDDESKALCDSPSSCASFSSSSLVPLSGRFIRSILCLYCDIADCQRVVVG